MLVDLFNLNEQFGDKDKTLMFLNSLLDDYEQLNIMLLNRKDKFYFYDICTALHSYEIMINDKVIHRDAIAKVLTRDHFLSRKPGKKGNSQSKPRLVKDECGFC